MSRAVLVAVISMFSIAALLARRQICGCAGLDSLLETCGERSFSPLEGEKVK